MAIARLSCNGASLNLLSAPYSLGDDFVPPSTVPAYNLTVGTSANRYGGGVLVGSKANNIEWSFTVRILGSTTQYIEAAARRLSAFLKQAGPVWLEFSSFDVEPLWGQTLGRYEIVTGDVYLGDEYTDSRLRTMANRARVELNIKPYRYGIQQRLASALGGVWLDTLGTGNGEARGLRVPEATTNKAKNPVISTGRALAVSWTEGANLIVSDLIDKRYRFPGSVYATLIISKSAVGNTFTESIAAGNANKHSISGLFYRPDGGAVTSSDVQMYYGGALATTFRSLGNGLYLGYSDNFDGVAGATATGIVVPAGRSVIFLGYQLEEKAYHTPICFGEMLGCAWTGTAAASTTTRTAGRVRLAVASDTFVNNLWAVHFAWIPDYASTAAGDRYLFSLGAANIRCTFTAADDKINLLDNTNTASTAALTFSASDVLEVLAVGGNSGLAVYVKNHTTGTTYSGTNATYTVPAAASYIYIGTDDSAANHAGGIFPLFETYNDDLTSAQNTALQAALSAILTAGGHVGDIPWLWTKDGDNTVDNCNDSTRDNFCVCHGIPGTAAADTEYYLNLDPIAGLGTHWIGNRIERDFWRNPVTNFWSEGGATAEATNCNGDYFDINNGAGSYFVEALPRKPKSLTGKAHYFIRAKSEVGTQSLSCVPGYLTNTSAKDGSTLSLSMDTSYRLWYLGSMEIVSNPLIAEEFYTLSLFVVMTPGAHDFRMDFATCITGPLLKITCNVYSGAAGVGYVAAAPSSLLINGMTANYYSTCYYPTATGDVINLEPGAYNTLQSLIGSHGATHDLDAPLVYAYVKITPRWSLL